MKNFNSESTTKIIVLVVVSIISLGLGYGIAEIIKISLGIHWLQGVKGVEKQCHY